MTGIVLMLCALQVGLPALAAPPLSGFRLNPRDRIVFLEAATSPDARYARHIETYVRARIPDLDAAFVLVPAPPAAVAIDASLGREVARARPTEVVIRLDGAGIIARPPVQAEIDGYAAAYRTLLSEVRRAAPAARITLVTPSVYDDITRPRPSAWQSNAVLRHFAEPVALAATGSGALVADANRSMGLALAAAAGIDAPAAQQIVPDRVHAGPAGQLLIAAAVLRAWNAPKAGASVAIDARDGAVREAFRTVVTQVDAATGGLAWTQTDAALPAPVDYRDRATALVVQAADLASSLNGQRLAIDHLPPGTYEVRIDGRPMGRFAARDLVAGIDFEGLDTPMLEQAREVERLTDERHALLVRQGAGGKPEAARDAEIVRRQREAARSRPHRWEVREVH